MWLGPSSNDFVNLSLVAGDVDGVGGGVQVGYIHSVAAWWRGSSNFYYVETGTNVDSSFLHDVDAGWAVGEFVPFAGEAAKYSYPMLWKLTNDYSEAGINLLPTNNKNIVGGIIKGITGATTNDPGTQVGAVQQVNVWTASLWHGRPDSYVDLHPYHVTNGWNYSIAYAAYGAQQGGKVEFFDGEFTLDAHAALWSGTSNSFQDLHPAQAPAGWMSTINGMAEQIKVGGLLGVIHGDPSNSYIATTAGAWMGPANTFINLGDFLPEEYTNSYAYGADWVSAEELWVVGQAQNTARLNFTEAMLWIYTVPEPSAMVLFGGAAMLAGRRRRRR